ncbi:DUF4238 domain-containing protein [Plantibacter flavus]|uniref:DUF4238 domain-containing protein n=1 Tax=Plantibacter flavus TaxID=150123 RepID=UPI00099B3877|nr:DUF4238 domain-containing protein [Plantibacter flavus]
MMTNRSENLWEIAWRNAEAMTAAGQEPRRHHLLPRFYLQRWAIEDRVRVIDLERDRNAYEPAPERAAFETDFYRLPDSRGLPVVYWEAWLSAVEGHASQAFAVLDTDRPGDLDEEQHQWLALFIAVQMTRGRKARAKRRAMLAAELTQILDAYGPENLANDLRQGDLFAYTANDSIETIMADVERFRSDPSQLPLTREQDLRVFAHTATHVAGLITMRHFAIYKTPRALITSDEPMLELHEDMANPSLSGGVWGAPILAFPIGPYRVAAFYRRDIEPRQPGSTLSINETVDLNAALLANAHSFAIARPGDLIAERLFLPDAQSFRSSRQPDPKSGNMLFRFWSPSRWEGQPNAPTRVVSRWWPPHVPPASPPTEEEQRIIDGWT